MDIRCNSDDAKRYRALLQKNMIMNAENIKITVQDDIEIPVIMITSGGQSLPWTTGKKNIESFLVHGYVKIIERCPFTMWGLRKCRGEQCQLYLVRNNTGDCSIKWQAIMSVEKE